MPRAEDLPPAIAAVEEARARLLDSEAAYNRDLNLFQKKMLAASDFDKDRYTMQAARATLAKAEADLAKLKAGAWKEDIEVQRAAVEQAQSQVENIKIMLDRLVVRAPVDGEILQVNVRPGQYRGPGLERADDRPGRGQPVARPGGYRRERPLPLPRGRAGLGQHQGPAGAQVPTRVRADRALRHPQEEPDRRQHRARGHPRPPGSLRPARPAPAKVYVGQQMEVFLALGEDNKYLADTQTADARPAAHELVPAANPHGPTTTTADQPR